MPARLHPAVHPKLTVAGTRSVPRRWPTAPPVCGPCVLSSAEHLSLQRHLSGTRPHRVTWQLSGSSNCFPVHTQHPPGAGGWSGCPRGCEAAVTVPRRAALLTARTSCRLAWAPACAVCVLRTPRARHPWVCADPTRGFSPSPGEAERLLRSSRARRCPLRAFSRPLLWSSSSWSVVIFNGSYQSFCVLKTCRKCLLPARALLVFQPFSW